jgi:RNA polymerase sigma-70 factor, ECF subfamily
MWPQVRGTVAEQIQLDYNHVDLSKAEGHMLDSTTLSDTTLLERIGSGDARALEQLYERYVRQCFGLALRMLGEPALCEEVIQEVFLKIWTKPEGYSAQKGKFASWLLSVVHHRCIDELRRSSRTETPLDDETAGSILNTQPDPDPQPLEQVWIKEQQTAVRAALAQIPENQRQVLELAYFKGLSHSQIATRLGQPLGTVKTRIRLGMQGLRQLLEPYGLLSD